MTYLLPVAILVSLAMIALLWHSDPKRRRVVGLANGGFGAARRRSMVAGLLAPGAVIALGGDAAAFLIWLGSCAIGGWIIAQIQR